MWNKLHTIGRCSVSSVTFSLKLTSPSETWPFTSNRSSALTRASNAFARRQCYNTSNSINAKPTKLMPRLHDTAGCIVYTNIQPVVKPVWQPVNAVWQQVVSCKRGFSKKIVAKISERVTTFSSINFRLILSPSVYSTKCFRAHLLPEWLRIAKKLIVIYLKQSIMYQFHSL